MKRFRLRPLLFGTAFCVAIAGLVRGMETPARPSRKLLDGSTVTLEGVTYGPGEHRFATGNYLQRLLGRALPVGFAGKLGLNAGASPPPDWTSTDEDHLVCWFTWDTAGSREMSWTAAVNCENGWVMSDFDPKSGKQPIPFRARCFPRRTAQVGLGVYQTVATPPDYPVKLAAGFTLPNPAVAPHSSWAPEALPCTRSAGDVQVTLRELKNPRVSELSFPGLPEVRWVRLALEITPPGDAKDWRPAEIVLSDATGNRVNLGWQHSLYRQDRQGIWRIERWTELPDDPVWKVSVKLVRERDLPQRARFPRLALPAKGVNEPLELQAPIDGGAIVLERIGPARFGSASMAGPNGEEIPLDAYDLWFRKEGIPDASPLTISSVQAGKIEVEQWTAQAERGRWTVFMTAPPGCRTIDLDFEREHTRFPGRNSRTVEFIARPGRP